MSGVGETISDRGKHIIEGHEIDIADDSEVWPEAGKPIQVQFGSGDPFSATVPIHPTKSTWAKFSMEGESLPREEYAILIPPGANRTSLGMAEVRPFRNAWTPDDVKHQFELFDAIGRIAVFGGHVEMAMKKVLMTLRGGQHDLLDPSLPSDWDGLETL